MRSYYKVHWSHASGGGNSIGCCCCSSQRCSAESNALYCSMLAAHIQDAESFVKVRARRLAENTSVVNEVGLAWGGLCQDVKLRCHCCTSQRADRQQSCSTSGCSPLSNIRDRYLHAMRLSAFYSSSVTRNSAAAVPTADSNPLPTCCSARHDTLALRPQMQFQLCETGAELPSAQ